MLIHKVDEIRNIDVEKLRKDGTVKSIVESRGEYYLVEENRGIVGINMIPYTIPREKLEDMMASGHINKAYIFLCKEILLSKRDTLNRTGRAN